jgi:uncharacterized surface protein with fasciclin (FAS1) repeats
MRKTPFTFAAAMSFAAAPVAAQMSAPAVAQPRLDIVETAVAAGSFNTLATALRAAGLVETLKGKGPFTVFAPTDAAFARIPADTLQAILADKARLTRSDPATWCPGRDGADVVRLTSVATVGRHSRQHGERRRVNDHGPPADVMASNGVIHVIDRVLLPADYSAPEYPLRGTTMIFVTGATGYIGGRLIRGSWRGTSIAPARDPRRSPHRWRPGRRCRRPVAGDVLLPTLDHALAGITVAYYPSIR